MRILALLAVLCFIAPSPAHAHIRLESASPGAGDSIMGSPTRLELRFSAHIEAGYTALNLIAPNGQLVAIGPVTFAGGSDRVFTAAMPPLAIPGTYTVRWRTAGADGHVLEGSYAFVLLEDTTAAPIDTIPLIPDQIVEPVELHAHDSATGPADVAARWLHFTALLLLLGTMTLRILVLPKLDLAGDARVTAIRALWRSASFATLALIFAAILRLWLQSVALHGDDAALSAPLLSMMLTGTSWGRAWLAQATAFAVLAAGIAWARPARDSLGLVFALPATLALAAIPAFTGHAADAGGLVLLNDTLHVAASGAWLGTLAILTIAALPALMRTEASATITARAIAAFSPIALCAAAIVAVTGVINALLHFTSFSQLTATEYGRVLLVKLAFVACTVAAGFINWRVIRPGLAGGVDDARRLRLSVGAEIAFAALVLAATAYLTGVPRP